MTASLAGILFPRDLLQPRRADEHFRSEAAAARDLDLDVQLIDHDAVVADDIQGALSALAASDGAYLYRGWMIPPNQYRSMAQACTERGVSLVTSGDDFTSAHHLPRWYPAMSTATPESAWTDSDDLDDFVSVIAEFGDGPLVIKDFSKSEKHYWDEAMFIPVICHGDFAPYNCALRPDGTLAMFDFDTAHPGPRLWDIGYAAYRWVPLTRSDAARELADQRRRLHLFLDVYGDLDPRSVLESACDRLAALVNTMRQLAEEGNEAFGAHIADGHDRQYLSDIEFIDRNAAYLSS